jgi:hypothetical protein
LQAATCHYKSLQAITSYYAIMLLYDAIQDKDKDKNKDEDEDEDKQLLQTVLQRNSTIN